MPATGAAARPPPMAMPQRWRSGHPCAGGFPFGPLPRGAERNGARHVHVHYACLDAVHPFVPAGIYVHL